MAGLKEKYSDNLYDLRNIKYRCFNIKKSLCDQCITVILKPKFILKQRKQ